MRARASCSSKCVTAWRAARPSTDMRAEVLGSRPIGASMVPLRDGGRPCTSVTYSRSMRRARSMSESAVCAAGSRASTSRPVVSRSRRCTTPGRSGSSPPAMPCASRPWTSVASRRPEAGCVTSPAGLSTTSRYSSSKGISRPISTGSRPGPGSSSETSICSPPRRRRALPATAPSTVTRPAATWRSAEAREPTSSSSARKRSRRMPPASLGTVSASMR